jgi:hypothetical protein
MLGPVGNVFLRDSLHAWACFVVTTLMLLHAATIGMVRCQRWVKVILGPAVPPPGLDRPGAPLWAQATSCTRYGRRKGCLDAGKLLLHHCIMEWASKVLSRLSVKAFDLSRFVQEEEPQDEEDSEDEYRPSRGSRTGAARGRGGKRGRRTSGPAAGGRASGGRGSGGRGGKPASPVAGRPPGAAAMPPPGAGRPLAGMPGMMPGPRVVTGGQMMPGAVRPPQVPGMLPQPVVVMTPQVGLPCGYMPAFGKTACRFSVWHHARCTTAAPLLGRALHC